MKGGLEDFFRLTPTGILDSVEAALQREEPDLRATGRAIALNSLENRVYDVELEDDSHVVAKFYRPGRWRREQILEEHGFLFALDDAEIPVIAPLELDGESLFESENGMLFCLFPKVRGRLLDELDDERLKTLGRYIGRIHNVGATYPFRHRLRLNVQDWGYGPVKYLLDFMDPNYHARFIAITDALLGRVENDLKNQNFLSLHGDCHLGNTLWQLDSPFFLDFDDSMSAPAVQDIWMVVRGRGEDAEKDRNTLLEGYEAFRPFPRASLRLIEPLRALRMIHYSAWIAKRWDDPAFQQAFPHFGSARYWEEEIQALQEVLALVQE